jgi:hypothetical protein
MADKLKILNEFGAEQEQLFKICEQLKYKLDMKASWDDLTGKFKELRDNSDSSHLCK